MVGILNVYSFMSVMNWVSRCLGQVQVPVNICIYLLSHTGRLSSHEVFYAQCTFYKFVQRVSS